MCSLVAMLRVNLFRLQDFKMVILAFPEAWHDKLIRGKRPTVPGLELGLTFQHLL